MAGASEETNLDVAAFLEGKREIAQMRKAVLVYGSSFPAVNATYELSGYQEQGPVFSSGAGFEITRRRDGSKLEWILCERSRKAKRRTVLYAAKIEEGGEEVQSSYLPFGAHWRGVGGLVSLQQPIRTRIVEIVGSSAEDEVGFAAFFWPRFHWHPPQICRTLSLSLCYLLCFCILHAHMDLSQAFTALAFTDPCPTIDALIAPSLQSGSEAKEQVLPGSMTPARPLQGRQYRLTTAARTFLQFIGRNGDDNLSIYHVAAALRGVYDGMITDWLAWLLERGHLVNGESAVAAATESWKRTVPLVEGFEGKLNTLVAVCEEMSHDRRFRA